jgi:xanthine/uracil permease
MYNTMSDTAVSGTVQTSTANLDVRPLRRRARNQLIMLSAQFLLGMAVNLLGMPGEVGSNPAKAASYALTALHVLIGIGLLVGAVLTIRRALGWGRPIVRLAVFGGVSVGVAFAAGILTMAPGGDWWSYLMAVGFMAALVLYGLLYLHTYTSLSRE